MRTDSLSDDSTAADGQHDFMFETFQIFCRRMLARRARAQGRHSWVKSKIMLESTVGSIAVFFHFSLYTHFLFNISFHPDT